MNINATLLIQACNFFIVYWMLRIFLFKPVVNVINHEYAQDAALEGVIGQQKKSLAIQEKERQNAWYLCREYFKKHQVHRPVVITEFMHDVDVSVEHMPQQKIEDMAHHACSVLKEKIKHVH